MIVTQLTREDALQILEMGKAMHEESEYRDIPFNPLKLWNLLDMTLKYPTRYFIAYEKRGEEIIGGFLGQINEQYFSDTLVASDLAMYVKPDHRKGRVFFKMLRAFESWAKESGAKRIILGHTTGIETDKAEGLFNKLDYQTIGYVFNKDI